MKRIISSIFAGICLLATLPTYANIAKGESGSCVWVIDDDGNLEVSYKVDLDEGFLSGASEGRLDKWEGNAAPWHDYCESIVTASFTTPVMTFTCANMFADCSNLKAVYLDNLYTDNVTDMSNMFANCTSLEIVELSITNSSFEDETLICHPKSFTNFSSNFSTTSVKNMSGMFAGCKSLLSFYLPGIDMHNVTDFSNMFADCQSLESLDFTTLTVQKNANVTDMFKNCTALMNVANQSAFPNSISDATFLSLPTRGVCAVDVPLDCLEDYEEAKGWKYLFKADENKNIDLASSQTTSIDGIEVAEMDSSNVYALNGQTLNAPAKGVNIIDGKKVIVK